MKLNELNTKPMIYYNPIYTSDSYIDGVGLSKEHLFRIMSAEDLNISHIREIEKELYGNFPFVIDDVDGECKYELTGCPLIELSGKIARITFVVTSAKKYTIYIYLYKNVWYIL